MQECLLWSMHMVGSVIGAGVAYVDRVVANLATGLNISTGYSGIDTPLATLAMHVAAWSHKRTLMKEQSHPDILLRSSDTVESCRAALVASGKLRAQKRMQPSRPCVFDDLNDLLPNGVRQELGSIEAAAAPDPECYQKIDSFLCGASSGACFHSLAKAPCEMHGMCSLRSHALKESQGARSQIGRFPGMRRLDGKWWSSQGLERRHADPSMRPHSIWASERAAVGEHLIIHGCTPRYDISLLHSALPHYRVFRGVWSPLDMGQP